MTLLTSFTQQLWVLEEGKESRRWPCSPQMSPSIEAETHSDCSGLYKTSQKHQAGPRPRCPAQLSPTQRAEPEMQPAKRRTKVTVQVHSQATKQLPVPSPSRATSLRPPSPH